MKTILVPIDFSEASYTALHYAARVAKFSNARLIIAHIYSFPVPATDAPAMVIDVAAIEEGVKTALGKKVKEIEKEYQINVSSVCNTGFPVDGISSLADEHHADLIICGITGAGQLKQWLIGSTATGLLRKAGCPVLIVPAGFKFRQVKEILVASDNKDIEQGGLSVLTEFIRYFKAHLHVLNVAKHYAMSPVLIEPNAVNKLKALEKFSPQFHSMEGDDIILAIDKFTKKNKIDLVVMVPRSHPLLEQLLKGSITKKMAFHTEVPLLSLLNK